LLRTGETARLIQKIQMHGETNLTRVRHPIAGENLHSIEMILSCVGTKTNGKKAS
jgi:hypothetical protein